MTLIAISTCGLAVAVLVLTWHVRSLRRDLNRVNVMADAAERYILRQTQARAVAARAALSVKRPADFANPTEPGGAA